MQKQHIIGGFVILALVLGLVVPVLLQSGDTTPGKFDDFGQCLKDEGAIFYGAFWCPHCADQKALFENSSKIPYVECSNPNRTQTVACIQENIQSYPTWKFSNGLVTTGLMSLQQLSQATGCALPSA
jgi:thiol-disulfide isomerase/thioredoxin